MKKNGNIQNNKKDFLNTKRTKPDTKEEIKFKNNSDNFDENNNKKRKIKDNPIQKNQMITNIFSKVDTIKKVKNVSADEIKSPNSDFFIDIRNEANYPYLNNFEKNLEKDIENNNFNYNYQIDINLEEYKTEIYNKNSPKEDTKGGVGNFNSIKDINFKSIIRKNVNIDNDSKNSENNFDVFETNFGKIKEFKKTNLTNSKNHSNNILKYFSRLNTKVEKDINIHNEINDKNSIFLNNQLKNEIKLSKDTNFKNFEKNNIDKRNSHKIKNKSSFKADKTSQKEGNSIEKYEGSLDEIRLKKGEIINSKNKMIKNNEFNQTKIKENRNKIINNEIQLGGKTQNIYNFTEYLNKSDNKKFEKTINSKKIIKDKISKDMQYYLNNFFRIYSNMNIIEKTLIFPDLEIKKLKEVFVLKEKEEMHSKFEFFSSEINNINNLINTSYVRFSEFRLENTNFLKSNVFKKGIDLVFSDYDFELGYSCDYICIQNNFIFASIYFNKEIQKIVITFITLKISLKNDIILIEKINEENFFYIFIAKKDLINFNIKIISNTSLILTSFNEENYLFFFNYLNREKTNLECLDKIQNKNIKSKNIVFLQKFRVKNHLNQVDFFIKKDQTIEFIVADFDFKLLHFRFYINLEILECLIRLIDDLTNNEKNIDKFELEKFLDKKIFNLNLISTYEKFFFSKITDIKFIHLNENSQTNCGEISDKSKVSSAIYPKNNSKINNNKSTKNKEKKNNSSLKVKDKDLLEEQISQKFQNKSFIENDLIFNSKVEIEFENNIYFCVSSRDGFFHIFSLNSNTREIFKYKSSELWITSVNYSIENKIFLLTVNVDEKIIGIKFFSDKEYLVKRIPMTENSIRSFYCSNEDNLYILDNYNNIKYVKCSHFQSLFKNYKTRCRKNYNAEKIFEFVGCDSKKENKETLNGLKIGSTTNISKDINYKKESLKGIEKNLNLGNMDNDNKMEDEKFFVLNDELIINENEDKIFNFKIINFSLTLDKNCTINDYNNEIPEDYNGKVFILNRLNRISIIHE